MRASTPPDRVNFTDRLMYYWETVQPLQRGAARMMGRGAAARRLERLHFYLTIVAVTALVASITLLYLLLSNPPH
jgi:hypothetical protein